MDVAVGRDDDGATLGPSVIAVRLRDIPEAELRSLFAHAVRAVAEEHLTSRELEVAYLAIAEDLRTSFIAARLHITGKTVESHLFSIRRKCTAKPSGVRSRTHPLRPLAVEFWTRVGAFEYARAL